jgi:vacuolar-type H+-ATPase subunit F/Vma7
MDTDRICAACDERTSLGLSLAGVRNIFRWGKGDDGKRIAAWFREMIESDVEVIILTPEAGEALKNHLHRRRMEGRMKPLIVILPGGEEDTIARELIKRAIGMIPHEQRDK